MIFNGLRNVNSTVTGRAVRSQQNCEKQIPNRSYWHLYGLSVMYVFID
jgi:hypothetical protein